MLTESANNFTGTDKDDTFNAFLDQANAASRTISGADLIDGGKGTDTLNITATGTTLDVLNGALVKNIDIVNIRSATANTLDASQIAGLTEVNANTGAGAVTVTNLATGAAIGVIGNGTTTNGAVTFGYATAADAVTLNLSGGTKVGTTVTNSAAAGTATTTATINSMGTTANVIGALELDGDTTADLVTLNVNATAGLTATLTADDYVATGAALTVKGAGAVNIGDQGIFKTVDASNNTGGLTMTLDTVTTSFKGSTGNDTITTAILAAPAANIIDGGTGTDTLVVAAAADVATAALRGSYTGFEVLNNATNGTIAADGITGVTSLITSVAGGGFTGMTAAQAASVSVTADLTTTATSYALTTSSGLTDVLGLTFKSAVATTELDATKLTVTGFETLNLTVSSGGTSLYNAAGTTALTAGTDYSDLAIGVNTTDLTKVTLAGANAAKIDLSANATKVTTVDASANTAGANIVIGGQTGTVVVTGTDTRDIVTMNAAGAGGLQTVNTGAGNDSIFATQAIMAVATINGGAGTDTITLTDTGALALADNSFTNVSAIEKVSISAATGLSFSIGGFANALATANGGVLDVTASALTGAVTIDGTGLTGTNSMKLNLTNVDTAANATATTITLSKGADNITMTAADNTQTDTITISGGVAALASTAVKTIDLSAVTGTATGAISVTTGAGNDIVKAAATAGTYVLGAGNDTFTGGAGADTMTGNAGADIFVYTTLATAKDQTGITLATADKITDFVSGTDKISIGTAGSGTNYVEAAAATDFATAQTAADTAMNGTVAYYLTSTSADGGLLFIDSDMNGTADAVINLTGITDANFAFGDIIA